MAAYLNRVRVTVGLLSVAFGQPQCARRGRVLRIPPIASENRWMLGWMAAKRWLTPSGEKIWNRVHLNSCHRRRSPFRMACGLCLLENSKTRPTSDPENPAPPMGPELFISKTTHFRKRPWRSRRQTGRISDFVLDHVSRNPPDPVEIGEAGYAHLTGRHVGFDFSFSNGNPNLDGFPAFMWFGFLQNPKCVPYGIVGIFSSSIQHSNPPHGEASSVAMWC